MQLSNMNENNSARVKTKRLGRGIGSGHGKTSCKGHKGQWARSGGGVRPGFEGGTMPLIRRIPKRGFTNIYKAEYSVINISSLEVFEDGTIVDAELLLMEGILSKIEPYGIKILGNGSLTKKLTVKANKFTKSAAQMIEQAGGKAEVL